ncbi:hypothetical protein PS687_02600 [Pseudomonas fluorescens]|nr:hypothetical protein PS687_02600 [Pseudomonas fluorescens]
MTVHNLTAPVISPPAADASPPTRHKRGIASTSKLWPQHSVLKISLLNMTEEQKSLVKTNIKKWIPHTNLYLKFVETSNGDIRISADNTTSSGWSRVGTDAKNAPPYEPTMSIGFKNTPERIEAQVLHEFGHALGLRHEHQHPDRTLQIDDEGVYKEFESRSKTRAEAYNDILKKFYRSTVTTSPYDEHSIMHYSFPASRLIESNEIPKPLQLSAGDKNFIKSLYPEDSSPYGKLLNTLIRVLIKS